MISLAIRRPIATAMAYLAAALLGVLAWRNIPVELLPDTELPRLRVGASWRGASPEVAEAFLTAPMEAVVQQVRGVESVRSVSYQENGEGRSELDVEFARDADMDFARLELLERLALLDDELPEGARRPVVSDYVPDEFRSQRSVFLQYTVTGPYTGEALRAHVDEVIAPAVEQVDGVATVQVLGGRARELEVRLDESRIGALGLTPEDVRRRILELELVRDAGVVERGGVLLTLAIRQRAGSAADVAQAVLRADRGRVVRVADVATVHDGYEDPRMLYRIDGNPGVAFVVQKRQGVNAVAVADAVKQRLAERAAERLPGVRLLLDVDESRAIRAQLTDLRARATLSAVVIFLVLLVFLGSLRSVVIVCLTIAFSVLLAVNLLYFGGLSLNVLTLMGLAMGFGLIADNAIVVLENIFRRWRRGEAPAVAAERGAREVVLAIVAATATTLVVFIPFVYLQGELRLYYVPLALVVGLSLLASLAVSFSFIPALAARILEARGGPGVEDGGVPPAAGAPLHAPRRAPPVHARVYRGILTGTLRFPWIAIAAAVLVVAGSYWVFHENVSRGLMWRDWGDQGSYLMVEVRQPRGEELERTDELARWFEARIATLPGIARYTTRVYPQGASIRIAFPDSLQRSGLPEAYKEELTALGLGFGGAEVRVTGFGPSFYGGGSSPPSYTIKVLGYNYETVREIATGLEQRLTRFPRVKDVDVNATGRWFDADKPVEVVLDVDRRRLAMHDLTMQDVVSHVGAATQGGGRRARLAVGGEERQFSVKLAGYERFDVLALQELQLPTRGGAAVRLGDIATMDERYTMGRVQREDQQYQRTVAYEFRGPAKLGDRVQAAVIASTRLPDGYALEGKEEWSWTDGEQRQLYGVLALSLVLVFMVTAALFESLRQPVCVLLTVPMALSGVFVLFWLAGASFTREAVIGVIMMGGIVVNNAILLLDRVNQLRRHERMPLRDALVEGTMQRLRPILMTSVSTVLGLMPLVLFSEYADENIWNALGYALIGGLTSSTILVLTVTPAIYLLLERGPERRRLAAGPASSRTWSDDA
ncbi:MAG TPA: efflux RND transporter permease subunit [Gemmatimonadaceae bacterium]|nr:efflux RND transporter permease subunit [Gemmatimonadaceae bacterium]